MTVLLAAAASGVQPLPVIVTVALLLAALVAMAVSWRRRSVRQRDSDVPGTADDSGLAGVAIEGLYLATTFAGRPLDRVVAGGLGFRAAATITATADGVRIERDGAAPLFLAAHRLAGAGVATWTIDRSVEKNGLTVVAWRLDRTDGGADDVESAFRIELEPRADLIAAVRALVEATGVQTEEHGADID